ncbi:12S rRNA N4-methylcytidine methyltransferase-like isoform X2 [Biomphalaria glabrata]|nr:12S rRNA N4-methylcytidine methyltransferase-like isoform X2 [Biomphalaria glabrata]XP_055901034.1 12S rRNA N4-methylcytidine methyltransferase-like isoform X2 [Biomphalaria glabrata]XP_055901035.1 12S rRNA N4-methylcytidine methyltransferase-like isoform X2 [Biomphalaria glabrata]
MALCLKQTCLIQIKSLMQAVCQRFLYTSASKKLYLNGLKQWRDTCYKHSFCNRQHRACVNQFKHVHSSVKTESLVDEQNAPENKQSKKEVEHVPVMVTEVLELLQLKEGQLIVDMTFGGGGHAKEILKHTPNINYVASDRDSFAYNKAVELAASLNCGKMWPVLGRFSEISTNLDNLGIQPGQVDAFLFDLGTSSFQFDFPHRGFSLSKNGPLDMRMDGNRFPDQPTAADVVNTLDVADIEHILHKYGEEKKSKLIAHAIVEARYAYGKFTHTKQLAEVVQNVFNSDVFRQDKLSRPAHLATKTFQALRIFVNDELNEINNGLHIARHYLKSNGRCVVISFHSLEDRIVKRHFHDIDMDQESNITLHHHFRNTNLTFDMDVVKNDYLKKLWEPVSRKVLEPTEEEIQSNARSRSAKLRAAIKL